MELNNSRFDLDDYDELGGMPYQGAVEEIINNIVAQINPQTIIDNLDHALKGEQWNKEEGRWLLNDSKEPMVNDACRGAIISYLDGILNNNTTMANIVNEKKFSDLMESVIDSIVKMFVVNLEKFGFVPPGPTYHLKIYENKGTPDTARMTIVASMIYKVCFLVFSRAIRGEESRRIFKSLSMTDAMGYGGMMQQPKKGWMGKIFGGR